MLPNDYLPRTYAGVLGKIIGVYLGRPFEGWLYRDILSKLGEITGYINEKFNDPLIVTDDDISGTFTFLRALEDYCFSPDLTPEQIGLTWMNYIIENRTILWWGGLGMSTEHTAFLRMKHGIRPPESGSIAINGQVVAEQIGGQIFIDGWGLIHPGDPEKAADFARRAASVSHDGTAIHCAQIVAALVAQAFVEDDFDNLLDTALEFIPKDGLINQMIGDIRNWHAIGLDWQAGFEKIESNYGYDRYGGNCHTVPNHAIIIHSLLHSQGSFSRALMIANTCGWDTDCNSGNVGCIMGVRNGLAGLSDGQDWRGPVADRLYLPTADGGRCVSDAVSETYRVVNTARALQGLPKEVPKKGARFHFELPGSVQGFRGELAELSNVEGFTKEGKRSLAIRSLAKGFEKPIVVTETFPRPEALKMAGYDLVASPSLSSGQTVRARVTSDVKNLGPIEINLIAHVYKEDDTLTGIRGTGVRLLPGESEEIAWLVPDTAGYPISEIGIALEETKEGEMAYLDYLTWDGPPEVTYRQVPGTVWRKQWVNGVSEFIPWGDPFRIVQNEGTGLLMTGCREWTDYCVESTITPHLAARAGIACRVQGMRRYYALALVRGVGLQLIKALDGEQVLASIPFEWELGNSFAMRIEVQRNQIHGKVNGESMIVVQDDVRPLEGGGIALFLTEGRMGSESVMVSPVAECR